MLRMIVVWLAASGCGERLLTPVHPDVVTDWTCLDINTVEHPCAPTEVKVVGVGELVYIGATWEGVCIDPRDGSFRSSPGGYPKGCRERPFNATASWFCVNARVDRRQYVATGVRVGGSLMTDVHAEGLIDLPSRSACRPVPLGASVDISVGAEHHMEVFEPTASAGYYR